MARKESYFWSWSEVELARRKEKKEGKENKRQND